MHIFTYDKTFEGFLTVVFDAYEKKIEPDKILSAENQQTSLFAESHPVITDEKKAERVWKGLHTKLSAQACKMLSVVFLSEKENVELLLFNFVRKAFDSVQSIENNFSDPVVLEVFQIFQKVSREVGRVPMFVRFQKTADGIYFASFDPEYNIIPLSIHFFRNRFPDQPWIIYDTRRKYGFYYDLNTVSEIRFDESKIHKVTGKLDESVLAADEKIFQELWKNYFDHIAINERKNPILHRKLLPKRFWKYLPEKGLR